jgi:hypothetical protein
VKVLDISDKGYDYELTKKKEERKLMKMRIDNMGNIEKILHTMFGDQSSDKMFKDIIDNDITR